MNQAERTGSADQDRVEWTGSADQDRVEWTGSAGQTKVDQSAWQRIEDLKKEYPDITFYLAEDKGDRAKLAASLGKGLFLVVSREFLDRMQSSREKLKQCAGKRAEKQKNERKSRRLELELKQMRAAGKSSDYILVCEGKADESYVRGYRKYKGAREAYEQLIRPAGDMQELFAGMGAGMGDLPGGEISAGDIVISGESSF